jgi:SPP1 gp7 family putative phage head morphogenesis protein
MADRDARPEAEESLNPIRDLYFGTAERSVTDSPYVPETMMKPYNTDELYRRTGDYRIYEEMVNDDQASVCMQLKKDLVVGCGWTIVTEKGGEKSIADDIYQRLEEDSEGTLDDMLEELIDNSYSYGFALAEKLFKYRDDNSLSFRSLKTRHPNSWLIHTDRHGNVIRYEQRADKVSLNIPPKSLIHYINNPRWQNPYGKSDLRKAYEAWMVKRHLIRYFSIFAEKYASPVPVAKYEKNTPHDKVTEIFSIIKKFMQKTALVLPKEIEVQFLEAKSNGEAFIKGVNLMNMFIGRSLVIPDLLGFSGSESQTGGSQALGREQMNVFMQHIKRRRRTLERVVNRHIVQPLVVWNYGNVKMFPKFQLLPISNDEAENYARMFLEAVKGRAYKPTPEEINHFRSIIKFPEGTVEFHEDPALVDPDSENRPRNKNKPNGGQNGNDEKDDAEEEAGAQNYSAYERPQVDYGQKVDFKALEDQLQAQEKRTVDDARPIVDEIFVDLSDQIQKKKILDGFPERIDSIKLSRLKNLQTHFKGSFTRFYKESRITARKEIFTLKFKTPLASDKFLEFVENETFDYVGDWEYKVTQATRIMLQNAIKDGRPLSWALEQAEGEIKEMSMQSIERYSRTKTTEVMNRARVEEFSESGAVQGFQYSAILDDRTSDICAGLHGATFKMGKEPIPPMHFNCRSVLIPITIFEKFDPTESINGQSVEDFIDENKGKGFSTR